MRIPTNSNFSREIAKRFETIFHREMSLGGLQDLQEQLDLINPVDTYLQKQVSHLEKANATTKTSVQDARAIRSTEPKGKGFVKKIVQNKRTEEEFAV
jgi:hypothetical protein